MDISMLSTLPAPGPDQYRKIFGIQGKEMSMRQMGKVIKKKSLHFLLWLVSKKQPIKAYGAIKMMQAEGLFFATPNRIYPLFSLMEKQKLVESRKLSGDKRGAKEYFITPKGKELLRLSRLMLNRGLIGEYMKDMVD
jgi:DNA-binding PadR family transcriptional regulator